jgi:preprotein translocase subunit YajC
MFLLEGETPTTSPWPTLIIMGVMLVFFYFFMIRPQKKQQKQEAEMRNALAVGDEVTTIGGIIGKVVSIKGETFVLETTKDKTKIRFLKGAVRSVDVKAADIAAAVLETQEVPAEEPVEAPVETEETQENQ